MRISSFFYHLKSVNTLYSGNQVMALFKMLLDVTGDITKARNLFYTATDVLQHLAKLFYRLCKVDAIYQRRVRQSELRRLAVFYSFKDLFTAIHFFLFFLYQSRNDCSGGAGISRSLY